MVRQFHHQSYSALFLKKSRKIIFLYIFRRLKSYLDLLMECVTACAHCGSKIKGTWTQEELIIMKKYSEKHNKGTIQVEYERLTDRKILAKHLNRTCFNWVIWQETLDF